MVNPDMRAIVFSFVIADVAITFFMILLAVQNRRRFSGLNAWLAAFILQNLAVILIVLRGSVPDWVSMFLSNTMVVAGMLAGLKGMSIFTGVKMKHFHNYLIILLFAIFQFRFSVTEPNLAIRNLNLAIAMLLFSGQYVWLVFFRATGRMRYLSTGVGIIYIGYAVVNIIRIAHYFVTQSTTNDYFQADTFEKAVFISYQVLFIFLAYSLALMYNRQMLFALATQEEKYSKAFNSSPYAILMTRYSDGKILEVNKGFSRMTGYSYEEAIGKTTNQLQVWITDSDRDDFVKELSAGRVFESRKQFRMKSGEIITALLSAELINVNDEVLIISSINDITPLTQKENLLREKVTDLEALNRSMTLEIGRRKQAEEKIKESEQKFRNLFENSPLGNSIADLEGRIYVNRSFCDMLGYTPEEMNNMNWREITHPDDISLNEQVNKMLLDGICDRHRFEKRYYHSKGRLVWAEISIFLQRDEKGEPSFFITTINDITERKKLENEKFRLLDIIDSSLNEIYIFNTDNLKFEYVNKGALKNIGFSLKEMQKLTPLDIKPELDENAFRNYLASLERGKRKIAVLETNHRRKDGSTYPVEVHVQLYNKNESSLFFAFIHDITERKLADEAIRNLNEELEDRVIRRTAQLEAANKELEAFTYTVSHDLRAPLRAIHSFTSILRKDFESQLGEEGGRICGIIENSSVRMGTLIDDLLSFSRVGRSQINHSRISMNAIARKVYEEITTKEERALISFRINNLADATGDESLIRQALANLLTNAVKYSSKNVHPVITLSSEQREDEIVYSVTDNGVGFNMKYVDKLFKVFQRLHSDREFEGNGVGLAIVERIVSRHGGRVWAESGINEGATFSFTLPAFQKNNGRN